MQARHIPAGSVLSICLLFIGLICLQGIVAVEAGAAENRLIHSGIENFSKGLYSKAIKNLKAGLGETLSSSAEGWYFLGSSFSKIGKFDEAIKAFKKALDIKPNYPEVYMGLGIAYHNKKNYAEALSAFNKVLKIEPNHGPARFFQGLALQGLKKHDLAISSFQLSGSIDPDFQQLAQFNVGLLHFQNKRREEAIAQFKASIETDPESDTAATAREFLDLIASQKPPKPWQASFRAGASIDDNITLTDISLTTGLGDLVTFYSFSGSYLWEPIETYNLNTGYDFFQNIYDSLHQFDMQIHSGFVSASKSIDEVDLNMGYTFNYIKLGGIDFEFIHTFNSGLSFELMDGWFVDLSYFLSAKKFVDIRQRDGHNHSLRISNYFTLGDEGGLAWVVYTPEGEVTRDPQVTYVAQNVSVGAQHPVPGLESLKTKVRANYSYTYQDYLFITPFIGRERADFRNQVSFEIIQPVLDTFDITFQYQYINSQSNLLANDFVENVFSLSAGATF